MVLEFCELYWSAFVRVVGLEEHIPWPDRESGIRLKTNLNKIESTVHLLFSCCQGRSSSWFLLAHMFGVLRAVVALAFAPAKRNPEFAAGACGDPSAEAADGDESEPSWHRVAGARYARLERSLENPVHTVVSIAVALVFEPFHTLTYLFMHWSSRDRDYSKFPPLMDLIWERTSPLVWCLQHLSDVLNGTSPRLKMLLGYMRCSNVDDWLSSFPAQAAYIRRLVLQALSLIEYRHVAKYTAFPWAIFSCGDTRRGAEERRSLAATFKTKRACCLPFGMARDLTSVVDEEELVGPKWAGIFKLAAWQVRLSLFVIECLHARNRRSADARMDWANLSSRFVNGELYERSEQRRAQERAERVEPQARVVSDDDTAALRSGDPGPPTAAKASPLKTQTPLHVFRSQWLEGERKLERHWNCCSSNTWDAVKEAFGKLGAEQLSAIQDQASASKGLAAFARRQAKEKANVLPPALCDAPRIEESTDEISTAEAVVPLDPAIALPEKARPQELSVCFSHEDSMRDIITQGHPDLSKVCCSSVAATKQAQLALGDRPAQPVNPAFFRTFYNRGKSFLADDRACTFCKAEAVYQKASSQVAFFGIQETQIIFVDSFAPRIHAVFKKASSQLFLKDVLELQSPTDDFFIHSLRAFRCTNQRHPLIDSGDMEQMTSQADLVADSGLPQVATY